MVSLVALVLGYRHWLSVLLVLL